jgi:methionine-gamma-lyase
MTQKMGFTSTCVREIKENRTTDPHILPLYATSSFAFTDIDQGIRIFSGEEQGHVYGRYGNPTIETVASKIAKLEGHDVEGAEPGCILFSSGMSAILSLILGTLKSGDKLLTQANLYGGTTEQFQKILAPNGIEPVFSNLSDPESIELQLKSDSSIKMIYGESPANPTLSCIDLEDIGLLAKKYQVLSVIDNTFATPYLQKPLQYDIDFIIHSTTKYLNGHGNSIAGALVAKDAEFLQERIWPVMKLAGTNANPWDAWLLHNGLKTLSLRMDRHCQNAQKLAEALEAEKSVVKVNYPGLVNHPDHALAKKQMRGFSGMLSFELSGGLQHGLSFMRKISFCKLAPTLGDVDTLILHPASMSHLNIPSDVREAQGITDGLIRLSVGIEDFADIHQDLTQALA